MPHFYRACKGAVGGLSLPSLAWKVLQRENIKTMGHLRAIAGQLEQFDGRLQ